MAAQNSFIDQMNRIVGWNSIKDSSEATISRMDFVMPLALAALQTLNESPLILKDHVYKSHDENGINTGKLLTSIFEESVMVKLKIKFNDLDEPSQSKLEAYVKKYDVTREVDAKIKLIQEMKENVSFEKFQLSELIQEALQDVKLFAENYEETKAKLVHSLQSEMAELFCRKNILESEAHLIAQEIELVKEQHIAYFQFGWNQYYSKKDRLGKPIVTQLDSLHYKIDRIYFRKEQEIDLKIFRNNQKLKSLKDTESIEKIQNQNHAYCLQKESLAKEKELKHKEICS